MFRPKMKSLQDRWLSPTHAPHRARDLTPLSWNCVDCGINTAPSLLARAELLLAFAILGTAEQTVTEDQVMEVYTLHDDVWAATGLPGWGGCLCVECAEKRLGRHLVPPDFDPDHPLNDLPATPLLRARRGR